VTVHRRILPGEELAGYRVEELAGRGGMGEVYRARDTRLDRPVALKLLNPALADDEDFRERLLRESRLAAGLDHPNVIPIYEAGDADGRLFIAMRYVDGTDLKALLRREGALAPAHAIGIAAQLADALDAAHRRGLVHRDVKPSNVLIDEQDGREHCYLADFGLTQSVSDRGPTDGRLMGTLDYVSPEQIRGDEVDGRADVYALGCLVFEALTGTLPFSGASDTALVFAHLAEEPPRATDRRPELPAAVDAVLGRAMAKDPADRPETCAALVEELRDALGLKPPPAAPRRRTVVVALLAVLAATGIALGVVLGTGGGDATPGPSGSVVRIDPTTASVTGRFPLGPHPDHVAAGSGRVWASSLRGAALWQVEPRSGEVRRVTTNGSPRDLAIADGRVYVVSDGPGLAIGTVTPYDVQTTEKREGLTLVTCSITAGKGYGVWTSACPNVERLVDDGGAPRIAVETNIPYAVPHTAGRNRACQCDMAVGYGTVWVLGDPADPRLWRLDPRTGRVRATIRIPFPVQSVAVGAGGAWVTDPLGDRVARVDPATDRVTRVIPVGRGASGVATAANQVWVANSLEGTVSRLNPGTGRVVQTIPVGGRPEEVAAGDGALWVTVDGA
jgi:YVTN family beta-propeller protein